MILTKITYDRLLRNSGNILEIKTISLAGVFASRFFQVQKKCLACTDFLCRIVIV